MRSIANCTKTSCIIILELCYHASNSRAQVFQYIEGLKDGVKDQVPLQRPIDFLDAKLLVKQADMAMF